MDFDAVDAALSDLVDRATEHEAAAENLMGAGTNEKKLSANVYGAHQLGLMIDALADMLREHFRTREEGVASR